MPFTNKTISLTPGSAGAAVLARAMFQCHLVTPNLSRDSTETPKYDWAIAGTAQRLQNLTELQQGQHTSSKIWLSYSRESMPPPKSDWAQPHQRHHGNSKTWVGYRRDSTATPKSDRVPARTPQHPSLSGTLGTAGSPGDTQTDRQTDSARFTRHNTRTWIAGNTLHTLLLQPALTVQASVS